MSFFEIGMLVCFGAAWPVNIAKSLRSRTAKGKSLFFLLIVLAGYISGILHKLLFSPDPVIFLYVLNLLMVGADTVIWFQNTARDKKAEAGMPTSA